MNDSKEFEIRGFNPGKRANNKMEESKSQTLIKFYYFIFRIRLIQRLCRP